MDKYAFWLLYIESLSLVTTQISDQLVSASYRPIELRVESLIVKYASETRCS